MVYSTNPGYQFGDEEKEVVETLPPSQQLLYISLDKKQRKGKKVTLVTGFVGDVNDLKELGKKLKNSCGAGGSVKNGEILVQGDFREKIKAILQNMGFKVKMKGG